MGKETKLVEQRKNYRIGKKLQRHPSVIGGVGYKCGKGCEENHFCYSCHFPYCLGLSRRAGCSSDHSCVRKVLSDMGRHQQTVRRSTGAFPCRRTQREFGLFSLAKHRRRQDVISLYKLIRWVNTREKKLLKLKNNVGRRTNSYKLPMNKFRLEIR